MNSPVDIVVTWVDNTLPEWQQEYEYWKKVEVERGIQKPNHGDAFSSTRYRSWNVFKYWFRGVAENCPWVNKVFLIVENKKHVPDWLDQNCEKLRIVEHKQFIPEELLPLFNGPVIDLWYSRIPDLSENFIVCDDDYYFMNLIPDDFFFKNNVPQSSFLKTKYINLSNFLKPVLSTWMLTCANTDLYASYISNNKNYMLLYSHQPEPRKKSFEQGILNNKEYYNEIYKRSKISHFRHDENILGHLFIHLLKLENITQDSDNINKYSKYVGLKVKDSAEIVQAIHSKEYKLVCLNDVETNYPELLNLLVIRIFEEKFPNKCYFER